MASSSLARISLRTMRDRPLCPSLLLIVGLLTVTLSTTRQAIAAGLLPQGGRYAVGAGTIAGDGARLLVTQPGKTRGIIDWDSFSIGKSNTVNFSNGSGATLNRVTGGSPSAILGNLSATGSLYVINPQGVLVGTSGVVSTGGRFVASTLDICNDSFAKDGDELTLRGKSDASVTNLGRITSSAGDVILIARHAVINAGIISAPNGTAELAAGEAVLLQDSSSSKQVFVQTGSYGTVVSEGRMKAAQVSLQAADGNVYALAGAGTRIRATGTGTRNGHVWLIAESGVVIQDGIVGASNLDGSGAAVDTRAALLKFGEHAAIRADQWNVSTPALTIDDGVAGAMQRSLSANTSIEVTTTGANGARGDLKVASSVRWQGPASLALGAFHDVSITSGTTVKNDGAGRLTLRADASGIDDGGSVHNHGIIDWSGSTGLVSALYDQTGSYGAGNILLNKTWIVPQDSGLVTQATGYKLVNSLADLEKISLDLAGSYALGKDVNARAPLGGSNTPIGSFPATPFTGQFDGMGHTIANLAIVGSPTEVDPGVGLFAAIGTGSVVRNLSVQGNISGPANGGYYGVLAGLDFGTIASVHTSGAVVSPSGNSEVGGLVGFAGGTVTRSSSDAAIMSGATVTGGLVGYNVGVVRQSYSSGNVDASFAIGVGGLVGVNQNTITQSYATGRVSSPAECVCAGALVGQNDFSTVDQSFATGRVGAPGSGAGIAAYNYGPVTIAHDVFWDKQTTGANVAVLGLAQGAQPGGAQGLTTAQMSMPSSFGPTYDFGPNGVWIMPPGGVHPILRFQIAH
jgi:filamentous hemagglutinin family protein